MFYSFFNSQANLLGTEFEKIATNEMGLKKGAGRALYVYVLGFLAPSILYDGIRLMMAGPQQGQDDEDYLKGVMEVFFASQAKSLGAMVPVAGPIAMAAIGAFTKTPTDDDVRVSPAVSTIESAAHAPADIYKALSKKQLTGTEIKDVMTAAGLLSGLPTGTFANALKYFADIQHQKVRPPSGPVDAVRGALSGRGQKY